MANVKTTVIVRNMTEQFWAGHGSYVKGCDNMPALELFLHLQNVARDLPKNITFKNGNGSFADRVEWNRAFKSGLPLAVKREKRRGYILLTFSL